MSLGIHFVIDGLIKTLVFKKNHAIYKNLLCPLHTCVFHIIHCVINKQAYAEKGAPKQRSVPTLRFSTFTNKFKRHERNITLTSSNQVSDFGAKKGEVLKDEGKKIGVELELRQNVIELVSC